MSAAAGPAIAVCLTVAAGAFGAVYLLGHPLAIVPLAVLPLVFAVAVRSLDRPFDLCLLFVIFSFFRIHEVFPVLYPFRIPIMLALATFAALGWNMFLKRSVTPYWSTDLIVFLIFFAHITVGIAFATDAPTALGYWTGTYYKIAVMTLAIAWLAREPGDFARLIHGIILAGICVAAVALWNKANGIGLVEGTRVTIGRNIRSALGDPNDLSLVLLFPMAFGVALFMTRGVGAAQKTLGLIAVLMIAAAVIATQSRGGLLGMLAVWGVVANRYVKNKSILVVGGLLAAVALAAMMGLSNRQSGGAHEDGLDESAEGRIHAWMAAMRMALANPIFGVGLDNFIPNYFFYTDVWRGTVHAVHSTWFVVIAEGGFPGIGLFVAMIVLMARSTIRAARLLEAADAPAPARTLALAMLAGLAGFCVSGTFLTQGFTWPIYIKLGIVVALDRYANSHARETHTPSQDANRKPLQFANMRHTPRPF